MLSLRPKSYGPNQELNRVNDVPDRSGLYDFEDPDLTDEDVGEVEALMARIAARHKR